MTYRFLHLAFLIIAAGKLHAQQGTVVINEVCAANIDQFVDPAYNYGGWIELYNPTSSQISLDGLYVSDESNTPKMHQLTKDHGTVAPYGFSVLWFEHFNKNLTRPGDTHLQIPFKLNADGGVIMLCNEAGEVVCEASYPPSVPRCSYARTEDGADVWKMTSTPTPGASNKGSLFAQDRLTPPTPSSNGGVFEMDSIIELIVDKPAGSTLIYTTDGSTPTLSNGKESDTGRFIINKTTVLRFACYRNGFLPSPVVTRSFIFRNHDYYLPVLSVVTNPDHLFDDYIGVYCSGKNGFKGNGSSVPMNWNNLWERPVNMEYMVPEKAASKREQYETGFGIAEREQARAKPKADTEGGIVFTTVLNQEVDFEVCGGLPRTFGRTTLDGKSWEMRSSFRLKCDKRYEGKNFIDYPVFRNKPYIKNKTWTVRNGGNDTKARIRCAAQCQIPIRAGFYLDTQDAQPCHVFFNGDYVGMFNIRETNNRHFGDSNYGIDTDDMDQFEIHGQHDQHVGDRLAWDELIGRAKTLSRTPTEENYQKVCELLDVDEFCNYTAYEFYLGGKDWLTNKNNIKAFRSRSDGGKYHFVLFDTEESFCYDDYISKVVNNDYGGEADDLWRYLMTYPPFRQNFIDAYCIVDGTLMNNGRVTDLINEMYDERQRALSFENQSCSKTLITTIQEKRNKIRISHLKETLSLPAGYRVTISCSLDCAQICLNGKTVPYGDFDGYLFDADGKGIMLVAKCPVGYSFKGWEINDDDNRLIAGDTLFVNQLPPSETCKIHALFSEIYSSEERIPNGITPIRINEVSAANDIYINEYGKKADWVELFNTSDKDFDLEGAYLSDDPQNAYKYQITATEGVSTIVPAHGHRLVWFDGKEQLTQIHVPFKLKNADDAFLSITDACGTWTDSLRYKAQPRWQTYGRFPDGGDSLAMFGRPTIELPNHLLTSTTLVPSIVIPDSTYDMISEGASTEIASIRYYNLHGMPITNLQGNQVVIQRIIYKDGHSESRKLSQLEVKSR